MDKSSKKKKYRKLHVRLSAADRRTVNMLLHQGKVPARIFRRAMTLHLLDESKPVLEIAASMAVDPMSVRNIGSRYHHGGLHRVLRDKPRPGQPVQISNRQEKEIIAVVCSAPPGERARWTLGLLREEIIRRQIVPSIGRETLRLMLHDAKVKPWLEKNVVHRGADR